MEIFGSCTTVLLTDKGYVVLLFIVSSLMLNIGQAPMYVHTL